MFTIRLSRRTVFLFVLVGLLAIPAWSWASHKFNDVPDSNIFHTDIAWLADAAVTKGCNPPDNDEFCPDDAVTRAQMAAFMRRFARYLDAEDGTPAQADNTDTLDGLDSTDLLRGVHGAMGYVWACGGASLAEYDPAEECEYAYNSSGGSMKVDRFGVGSYQVTFSGLSAGSPVRGHVQVTAYGLSPAHCQTEYWGGGADVAIKVQCYDLTGADKDAAFDLLFIW